jgi:hypothetical protein
MVCVAEDLLGFSLKVLAEFDCLMAVMKVLDELLEADGEKKADGDGADVNEEVGPGVVRFVRSVDVEH